jgi:hypothetical protein
MTAYGSLDLISARDSMTSSTDKSVSYTRRSMSASISQDGVFSSSELQGRLMEEMVQL